MSSHFSKTAASAVSLSLLFVPMAAVPAVAQDVPQATFTAQDNAEVLAQLTAPITTGWYSSQSSNATKGFDQRREESTMGHLVADMYLSAANSTGNTKADIAVIDPRQLHGEFPSALRTDLNAKAENITLADVNAVLADPQNIWTTQLTGAQLKTLLNQQWQHDESGNMSPDGTDYYLQLGLSANITYTHEGSQFRFSDTTVDYEHVQDVYINGQHVADTDIFTVALPESLLKGTNNFRVLKQSTASQNTGLKDTDAFVTYLKTQGTISPRYNKQAVRVETRNSMAWNPDDVPPANPFDAMYLNLTSYGAPELTTADLYVDEVKIGTVPVNNGTVSGNIDLASAGIAPGVHTVKLVTPQNIGTVVQFQYDLKEQTSWTFIDNSPKDPFYNEIAWVGRQGILRGWSDGTFRPTTNIERGAIAAALYRAAGSPDFTAPTTPSFSDVPTDYPFYKEIEWMKSVGITTGYADGTFRPHAAVNRDAMAAFLYRAAGEPDFIENAASPFLDIKPGDQFYKEVTWLAYSGVTRGWSDATFRPLQAVKRDAVAAFLYRYNLNQLGYSADAPVKTK